MWPRHFVILRQKPAELWLYRTGSDDKHPVVLYDYQPSRSGDHAVEFLKGFHGYLDPDGYSSYNKLENITRCGCWAHLRRKFVEAVAGKKASGAPPTAAETGRDYCDQLFRIEKQLKDVYTYLEYLLLYMPDTDWQNHPGDLEELMPWSETVQAECKV